MDEIKNAAAIGVARAINEPLAPDVENTPESQMCGCEPQKPKHVEFFKAGRVPPCLFEKYRGMPPA